MLRIKKSKGEDMDVIFKHSQVKSGTLLKYEWILCPVCGNKTRLKMRTRLCRTSVKTHLK
ncbi:cysteine-rich KTR domain-containing protein [Sedimentibacter acidaminivorans]|uniref:cysteine-rich KTR domain-containing protein n=1 Tax=Sedimentibacter acidaminivorans TaxID=913099 RepID=UPI003CC91127